MEQPKAVLVDIPKCIGCGSCSVACKMWNKLPYEAEAPPTGESTVLHYSNWMTLTHKKVSLQNQSVWRFVKYQCMHCREPACVSACFSKALEKKPNGAVIYHQHLCVGCRYCMLACPFGVPKYEWHETIPAVTKCQMCSTRIEKGHEPACVSVCPSGALCFGDYSEIKALAKQKIQEGGYISHVYGINEAGGTSWLYISDIPFANLGFSTKLSTHSLTQYPKRYLQWTPPLMVGGSILFTMFSLYTSRRRKIEEQEKSSPQKDMIDGEN